jgi:hypothetical protein
MAEQDTNATENTQDANSNVNVQNVDGAQSANVNLTMEEGKQAQPAEGPKPEDLGVTKEQFDKYYNTEKGEYNWQAHAKELEFKASQRADKSAEDPKQQSLDLKDGITEDQATNAIEQAGLNFDDLETKIVENGDIDKADYEALSKIGIPEEITQGYIQNLKDNATRHIENVFSAFGGEDNFEKAKAAAQKEYSPAELDNLTAQLADPNQYKLAVDVLSAKAGLVPNERGEALAGPNATAGQGTVVPYANQAEMVADMRDARYRTDANYRNRVQARVAASTFVDNPRLHSGGL